MKLPNGYGSVIKLSGKRRKPYAVRISYLKEQPDGTVKRAQKYLDYFEKQSEALSYLATYNENKKQNSVLPEHKKLTKALTFTELFNEWYSYKESLKKKPGKESFRNWRVAYKHFEKVHNIKINILTTYDLQECFDEYMDKSKSTINFMKLVLTGMWKLAMNKNLVSKDITDGLIYEYTEPEEQIHTKFEESEINKLWDCYKSIPNADLVLIYIYTGLRPIELLRIRKENVHLNDEVKYMIGGAKTANGKHRIIPLNNVIVPLIENRMYSSPISCEYLVTSKRTEKEFASSASFGNGTWRKIMKALDMNHVPHDGRYTFASLAEKYKMNDTCRKIIIGHARANKNKTAYKTGDTNDLTSGVYTEKTIPELWTEMQKIPSRF